MKHQRLQAVIVAVVARAGQVPETLRVILSDQISDGPKRMGKSFYFFLTPPSRNMALDTNTTLRSAGQTGKTRAYTFLARELGKVHQGARTWQWHDREGSSREQFHKVVKELVGSPPSCT